MIEITAAAKQRLLDLLAEKQGDIIGLLVGIKGRGPNGFEHFMRFISESEKPEDALVTAVGELRIFIDRASADKLKGSTIDFSPAKGGFDIDNPNPAWVWSDPLAQAVQDVLTQQINPAVAAHGGAVQLLEVKAKVAYIELGGGCVGCGMVDVTLKQGIEVAIKEAVPEIEAIIDTTDHASGTNPYFQPAKTPHHQPAKGGEAPRSPFA